MLYQEYTPSTSLGCYIDKYWVSKNYDHPAESKILPDGYIDIVFDINEESNNYSNNNIRISGMMTKFRHVICKQNSETFGIRFKAGQFNAISSFPISEIKNKVINASEILPNFNYTLLDELTDKKSQSDKIQVIDRFLMNQLNWSNANNLILSVCASVNASFQTINLVHIAQKHHISLRQLERRFKIAVGVTMKEYHSIVRFSKTIESISQNPKKSLLHTAFDNGYFDHAHLTKDIYKMAGINPSQI